MKKASAKKTAKTKAAKKNYGESYNRYKLHQGKQYTGMSIGRSHKWYYEEGVWLDKKVTPERWVINFEVKKRRAGKAPAGSGAPVGTEYHWFILAHQMVKKLDANTYSTDMNGLKFKLAHKRSNSEKWSLGDKGQRNQLIKILQAYIEELQEESIEEFMEQEQGVLRQRKKAVELPTVKVTKKKNVKKEAEELVEA